MVETNSGYNPQDQFRDRNNESKTPSLVVQNAVKSLDRYIGRHYGGLKTLRDRQMTVFEEMRDFINGGEIEGYIKLPTGVGKTVLFTEFIEATRLKTLIVVPTTILVTQTGKKIEQFAGELEFGKIYSAAKQFGKEVTITTYPSLLRNLGNGKIRPEDYELVVLDEFHESRSRLRTDAVKKFSQAIKLGFSATPPKSTFLKEIHSMSIKEAVEENLLSSFSVYIAQSDIDLTNVSLTERGDYDEEELRQAVDIYNRNKGAVELYQKLFEGQTAVVYCVGVKHAENMTRLFRDAGISSAFISGKTNKKEQEGILEQFAKGEIKVICNANILIRGFDEPRASVCLNLRPTFSAELAEQRGGRVLRKNPNDPQKHAYIVDFFDKTEDGRHIPVGFAQVAEGIYVIAGQRADRSDNGGKNRGDRRGISSGQEEIILPSGLRIIQDAEEVLRVTHEMEARKYQPAPEGWMNVYDLAMLIGRSTTFIRKLTASYRNEKYRDQFSFFLDKAGRLIQFVSPDLVNLIMKEAKSTQLPPEGWMTVREISKQVGVSDRSTQRAVDSYLDKYPQEYRQKFRHPRLGSIHDYFSPELAKEIVGNLSSRLPAPKGWAHTNAIRKTLGISHGLAVKFIEKYRKLHPNLAGQYRDKNGHLIEFFDPRLVAMVHNELSLKQHFPEGWFTKNDIVKAVGLSSTKKISRLIGELKRKRPNEIQRFFDSRGREFEYLSPQFKAIIIEEMTNQNKDPRRRK